MEHTVKQPLELANGKEYEHRSWGRVMFIAGHPHDGAALYVERQHPDNFDDTTVDTCETSDLTPCNDGESYWPFLGRNCKERQRQAKERNAAMLARVAAQKAVMDEVEKEVASYGLTLILHGGGDHLTIVGRTVVEYWPFSKARTAHVRGEQKGRPNISPEAACRLAQQIPEGV